MEERGQEHLAPPLRTGAEQIRTNFANALGYAKEFAFWVLGWPVISEDEDLKEGSSEVCAATQAEETNKLDSSQEGKGFVEQKSNASFSRTSSAPRNRDVETRPVPAGYIGNLNQQQEKALNELREMVRASDFGDTFSRYPEGDRWLLRYMRATMKDKNRRRIFQPRPAFRRVEKAVRWKDEQGLLEAKFADMRVPPTKALYEKVRPAYWFKDEGLGTVVMIERFGLLVSNISRRHMKDEQWFHCVGHMSEQLAEWLRSFRQEPVGIYAIIDMKGLSLMGFTSRLSAIKLLNGIAEQHYPEATDKVFIINTPSYFSRIFAMAKAFMDEDTLSKVQVHSGLPIGMFRKTFDVSKLPVEYGGDSKSFVGVSSDAQAAYERLSKKGS